MSKTLRFWSDGWRRAANKYDHLPIEENRRWKSGVRFCKATGRWIGFDKHLTKEEHEEFKRGRMPFSEAASLCTQRRLKQGRK